MKNWAVWLSAVVVGLSVSCTTFEKTEDKRSDREVAAISQERIKNAVQTLICADSGYTMKYIVNLPVNVENMNRDDQLADFQEYSAGKNFPSQYAVARRENKIVTITTRQAYPKNSILSIDLGSAAKQADGRMHFKASVHWELEVAPVNLSCFISSGPQLE